MPPDRDPNLENELRDLATHVEYPPTPDLASSVRGRLDAEGEASAPLSRPRSSLWWLAAAALVLLTAIPALSPVVRDVASDVFSSGAGGVAGRAAESGGQGGAASSGEQAGGPEAEREPTTYTQGAQAGNASGAAASASASALAGQGSSASPASAGRRSLGRGLGERVTLREVRGGVEAPVLLPHTPKLGRPDEAYDRADAPGFSFLYRGSWPTLPELGDTQISLILTQTPGDVGAAYLPGGTIEGLEKVSVNGGEAYWIPAGGNAPEVARSAGLLSNVLLWERDGQALRLEADVTKEEAVRIAESVR